MKEAEMATIGAFVVEALDHASDEARLGQIRERIKEFTRGFPLYASRLK
jgi:glycine hydroxymethyltransferase